VTLLAGALWWTARGHPGVARFSPAALVLATALIFSAPWWWYNLTYFGSLLPSSGAAQFDWNWRPGRALALAFYAAAHGLPLPIRPFWTLRYELVAVAVLAVSLGVTLRRYPPRTWAAAVGASRGLQFAVILMLHVGCVVVAYGFSFAWWMFDRYTAPMVVVAVPLVSLVSSDLLRSGKATAVIGGAASLLCLIGWSIAVAAPDARPYQHQVALVDRHVPPDERIAAFQSGTLGYFRDGVVNLDGKVNAEALGARRHLTEYLRVNDVRWVVDWPRHVQTRLDNPQAWSLVATSSVPDCPPCGFNLYRWSNPPNR
jgi:hypothetical protein